MSLVQKLFNAGVVGAGGAGFPTHVKAKSTVEFVLVNGAECEPLIHKDFELMCNFPDEIVSGVELMTSQTSAKKAYFGIKAKNANAIDEIEKIRKEVQNLIGTSNKLDKEREGLETYLETKKGEKEKIASPRRREDAKEEELSLCLCFAVFAASL